MILSIGLLYTSAMRLAFLGPVGTYGERAARRLASLAGHPEAELVPQEWERGCLGWVVLLAWVAVVTNPVVADPALRCRM